MVKEKICGIYCIENLINGKKYIGQSSDIDRRWNEHKNCLNKNKHENKHLQRSWNKYGEKNYNFILIECCDVDNLNEKEIYYIEKYNSFNDGYNMSLGGYGTRGHKHTKEFKERQRIRSLGRECTEITRNKISNAKKGKCSGENGSFYGKNHTDVSRKKMSDTRKIMYIGTGNPNYGKKCADESKDKMRKAMGNPVIQFDKNMNFVKRWESVKSTKLDGNSESSVTQCCRGIQKFHNGYIWKYASDVENIIN